jgi:hypothetical protein
MRQAKEAMLKVLDAKLGASPEWAAFRSIDRAIDGLTSANQHAALAVSGTSNLATGTAMGSLYGINVAHPAYTLGPSSKPPVSYADLAIAAIQEFRRPVPTPEMIDFIGKHRELSGDPEKIKVSIASTLSKDERIENVRWKNGRAWWIKGAARSIPTADFEQQNDFEEIGASSSTENAP